MHTLLATCLRASAFKFRFKVGLMMNSLSLASVFIDFWNWTSSFSTLSNCLFFEAAEYNADAYLPSRPYTCTGGFMSWADAAEVLKARTWNVLHYVILILNNYVSVIDFLHFYTYNHICFRGHDDDFLPHSMIIMFKGIIIKLQTLNLIWHEMTFSVHKPQNEKSLELPSLKS